MKTLTVNFKNVDNARTFVRSIENLNSTFDLIYGNYVVDAQSLLGVLTMDLKKNINLRITERNNEMDTILGKVAPYIAA